MVNFGYPLVHFFGQRKVDILCSIFTFNNTQAPRGRWDSYTKIALLGVIA